MRMAPLEQVRATARRRRRRDEDDRRARRHRFRLVEEPGHQPEPVLRAGLGDARPADDAMDDCEASSRRSGSGENAKIGTRGRKDARIRAVEPVRV